MKRTIVLIALAMFIAALVQFSLGRKLWGVSNTPGLWSGDIWSAYNSQFLLDPYTLTHISHGVLLYGILSVAGKGLSVNTRLVLAAGIESGWEVLENTNVTIERYRAETISLNYYGDSVVNSMGDILACIIGFAVASRLPTRVTIIGTIALEIILALWIRDNLTLNIVMLLRSSPAIRAWQLRQKPL